MKLDRGALRWGVSKPLLRQIQDAATDPSTDLPSLLRLCMVLASRLRNPTLKAWVDAELNGYSRDAALPEYRVVAAPSRMMVHSMTGSATIPVPQVAILHATAADVAEHILRVRVRPSVAEIVEFSKTGGMACPWPHQAIVAVAPFITEWDAIAANVEVPPQKLAGILDVIRTRVLNFALELEDADPTLGEEPTPTAGPAAERVSQIVNQTFNFHGGHARVTAPVTQIAGLEQRLRAGLIEEGLSPEEVEQVTALVRQEQKPQGVLAKMKKLGGAIAKKATETGVAEVVKQFFGG